jgi:hypothetical protein
MTVLLSTISRHIYQQNVSGSLWECLRVVGPESQSGQIPELPGPMQWPSGAPGSTWQLRRLAWEHLESQ